jgi:bacteriocin resistance YdeI/OmpD-like protein
MTTPSRRRLPVHRGRYFVAVRDVVRPAARVVADDPVAVALEVDDDIRAAELPSDLRAALGDEPAALAAFEALAPYKKEVVACVSEAKRTETRRRRLAQALRFLQTRLGRRA